MTPSWFLGDEDDAVFTELEKERDGEVVGNLCNGSGCGGFDIDHAKLVSVLHGNGSHRSSGHHCHVTQHHHEVEFELSAAGGVVRLCQDARLAMCHKGKEILRLYGIILLDGENVIL